MPPDVIRSLVLPDGIVTALSDRSLILRTTSGREQKLVLPTMTTTLFACRGPQERSWRLMVGDHSGSVTVLRLPLLEILGIHYLGKVPVSALTLHDPERNERIIVGMQNGDVHAIGQKLPGGSMLLFNIARQVGSIHSVDDIITVHSGWKREVWHWDGDAASVAKNCQLPPTPPKRNSRQLTLSTPARA